MNESKFKFLELLNLVKLSEISGVSYSKLYYRKTGETKEELEANDATKIANGIKTMLDPLFKTLGFRIKISRL